MNAPTKRKRASSRAHTPCPHCGWQAHGEPGLKAHISNVHQPRKDSMLTHAKALAEHLATLCDFHRDDDPDQLHADPITGAELVPANDAAGLVLATESGRKFMVTVEEMPA